MKNGNNLIDIKVINFYIKNYFKLFLLFVVIFLQDIFEKEYYDKVNDWIHCNIKIAINDIKTIQLEAKEALYKKIEKTIENLNSSSIDGKIENQNPDNFDGESTDCNDDNSI